MTKHRDETTEAIFHLFFNICGYLNHLNWGGGDLYRADYHNNLTSNRPLPPVLAEKRKIVQQLVNCFFENDIKRESCEQGAFTRWFELNRTLVAQYAPVSGRALRYSQEQFDQTRQHVDEEQTADLSDAAQLIEILNSATMVERRSLIGALQLICTPENIKILETRRNPDPDSNSLLDQIISAICNFINIISFNYIAPVQGKETTKRLFGLFDLANKNKKAELDDLLSRTYVHECIHVEFTDEEKQNAVPSDDRFFLI